MFSAQDVHDIDEIKFGIYSADEIKAFSVCKIDSKELKGPGTVYDKKMGVFDPIREPCETCGLKKDCPGHFGYIELAEPIIHPLLYKEATNILKCFCKHCYRLLVTKEQLELDGLDKLSLKKRIEKILKTKKTIEQCNYCKSPQPKVSYKSKTMEIVTEYKQKKGEPKISNVLTDEDVKNYFDSISNEDAESLGFDISLTHPRNLVLTILPVLPPVSRPPVYSDGNICDDDITYQLLEIVKVNNQLNKLGDEMKKAGGNVPGGEKKKLKLVQSLRFRISTMMSNSSGKAKHPTDSRSLKGIKERLSGKAQRMRGNLLGKRVDQSSRSVIGADPTLKINEFVMPEEIAKVHSRPEIVNKYNIAELEKLVNDGKANSVVTSNPVNPNTKFKIHLRHALYEKGTELFSGDIVVKKRDVFRLKLTEEKKIKLPLNRNKIPYIEIDTGTEKFEDSDLVIRKDGTVVEFKNPKKKHVSLKIGDIVERQLREGDMAIFGRQPTLHKASMQGLKIVPMKYKSFRFNLGLVKGYNADFDGDL